MGRVVPAVLALSIAVTGCGGDGGTDNAAVPGSNVVKAGNVAQPANAAAPAAAPATNASAGEGAALEPSFLVGRWTETDNCQETVEFRADGSFVFPWGEEARWELRGDVLAMVGNPQTIRLRVTGPDTMEATKASGNVRQWRRC